MALTPYKRACFQQALMRKVASDPGLRKQAGLFSDILDQSIPDPRENETARTILDPTIKGLGIGTGVGTSVGIGTGALINYLLNNKSLRSYILASLIGGVGGGVLGSTAGGGIGMIRGAVDANKKGLLV